MAEKLEISIVDGGSGGTGSPGPSPGGGPGPAPGGSPGPAPGGGPGPAPGGATGNAPGGTPKGNSGGILGDLSKVAEGEMTPFAFAVKMAQTEMKLLTNTLEMTSRAFTRLATLNPDALVDEISELAGKIPLVGQFASTYFNALHGFEKALDATAHRLAPFNAQLSASVAMAEVRQIMGDMGRAQRLGPQLAKFEDSKSRASQATQDAMATMLLAIMPRVNGVMGKIEEWAIFFNEFTAEVDKNGLKKALENLDKIEKNTKEKMKKQEFDSPELLRQIHAAMTDNARPWNGRPPKEQGDPINGIGGGPQARPFGI